MNSQIWLYYLPNWCCNRHCVYLYVPCSFEYTPSSHTLFSTPLFLFHSVTSSPLSVFILSLSVCLFFYGSLCVSPSVSDSQCDEKASLQIRAGRSTRSLEYRTVRAQRQIHTEFNSTQDSDQTTACERRKTRRRECMVTCIWPCWFLKKWAKQVFFPWICLLLFSSPAFSFHPSTNLSFRSDVISLLSSAGTGHVCRMQMSRVFVCVGDS